MKAIFVMALFVGFTFSAFAKKHAPIKRKKVPTVAAPKSEADETEGYIIRRTKTGILKIPKKETFRFEGSDVSGSAQKPSQTVLGKRPRSNSATLIPERRSYRADALTSVGAPSPAQQVFATGAR
jgi:hypothetical protein